jgi:hypothetical protein
MVAARHRYPARTVSLAAVFTKLRECSLAGVDVDKIPLDLTMGEVLRMTVLEIKELTDGQKTE